MTACQDTTARPRDVGLKFQLMPGSDAILLADAIFGHAATRVHQITTYHDTVNGLLFTSGLMLRIRQETDSCVQNVKSRNDLTTLANSRMEWEWPVTSGTPEVEHLAAVPELATIASQIVGRLVPIIVTDVWRTKHLVSLDDGAVAEASLDTGTVCSGGLSQPIHELELELKQGPVAPLYRLAIRLAVTAPMWISAESKAARGWPLRNGRGNGPSVLRKQRIAKKASASAGLHQFIGALLGHLTTNIAPTLSGDPEALRQMRGALRQLRAVFRLFRPLLHPDKIARLTGPLRQFAQTFGAARDWDVFCVQTLPAAIADLPQNDWTELSALADSRRGDARAAVHDAVRGPHFTRLVFGIALWSETCKALPQNHGTKQLTRRLSKIAPVLLDSFTVKAKQAGRHPEGLSMSELHDFRKALDRMNAAIGFLGGTYPAQAVTAYRKRSDAVRDIIGAANDAEVTKVLALQLAPEGGRDLSSSIIALGKWADQRQHHVLTDLKQAARRFSKEAAFWRD